MVAPTPERRVIERIGEYAIQRVIGEGGMGVVYEATERLSGRRVALKVLRDALTGSANARERFFNEMRVMARLEHPNIVRSLASSEIDGELVLVLEYLEGRTLREELARGRLRTDRIIAIATAVAAALAAAHEMDPPIVHRDLKPENLMLLADGSVKVMDFGVSKVLAGSGGSSTKQIGTVQYMSPEQAQGSAITPQTDLYALGLVIYEMLNGSPMFEAASLFVVMRHHLETPPPPLSAELRRDIPAALETLLFALLAKVPGDRPSSAREVLATLQSLHGYVSTSAATMVQAMTGPGPGVSALAHSAPGPLAPAPLRPVKKLDTIALLERFEKRRWPIVAIAASAIAAAAIAGAFVLFSGGDASSDAKKKKSPSAQPSAAPSDAVAPVPPPTSVPTPTSACPAGRVCVPFVPPDPARVVAEVIIDASGKFARELAPAAVLSTAIFSATVAGGAIDLTRPNGLVLLSYNVPPAGNISIQARATQLEATQRGVANQGGVIGSRACSFQTIFDAAVRDGLVVDASMNAILYGSTVPTDPTWSLSINEESAQLNGRTCAVASSSAQDRRKKKR